MKPHAFPMHHTHPQPRVEVLALQINSKFFTDLDQLGTLTEYLHPPRRQVEHLAKQAGSVLIA